MVPICDVLRDEGLVALTRADFPCSELQSLFEPLTLALDPEMTPEVPDVSKHLAHANMTIVYMTHEVNFAGAVSERVILMTGGEIVEVGKPELVVNAP